MSSSLPFSIALLIFLLTPSVIGIQAAEVVHAYNKKKKELVDKDTV